MHVFLNAFTQCSPCPQSKGQWKHPRDRTSRGYRSLAYWTEVARMLERGGFEALFFADIHGTYDVYRGSREAAVRHAVQIPCNDPTVLIPALAAATRNLGFATTYSTTYHPPYATAKLFSTLDHLTEGRVAWNVVTSYLRDAEENGLGKMLSHDERYDQADEYMEVVYRLWEESWEEDAIRRDVKGDVHTDPSKVHEIRHKGQHYSVKGPHICEPSPQRTPVLYQAGASSRGLDFAARHGEVLFTVFRNTEVARRYVDDIQERVRKEGRELRDVKILTGVAPIVGATQAEAEEKHRFALRHASPEGAFALFGGWTGIDLSGYEPDQRLDVIESEGMRFLAQYFSAVDPDRVWRIRDIGEWLSLGSVAPVLVGDPVRVADELERWIEEAGVDGFNVLPIQAPGLLEDFVDLVVPELERRGLRRGVGEGRTLRERYFGPGNARLAAEHLGSRYRREGAGPAAAR